MLHIRRDSKTRRLSLHQLIKDLQVDASQKTVRNALHDLGYYHKVAISLVETSITVYKEASALTVENWMGVTFTDEMSVKVGIETHTRDIVWRKDDEKFHPDCINYRKRRSGVGMMFWGVQEGKNGSRNFLFFLT